MINQPLSSALDSSVVRTVEILLATYNSATYLVPLIESLLAQSIQNFRLIISDDCSTDDTVAILQRYLPLFRHPVQLHVRSTQSGSAMANFAGLMQTSNADYVFLCDADDIWHPDKLEKFLALARSKEAALGSNTPMFLYSDARIINGYGIVTHPSYWRYKKITPARCVALPRLLICAPMLGCAALINRALVQLAANVPVGRVTGHDWWALLVAASLGHVSYLDEATIDYRIHGRNASQPKEVTFSRLSQLAGPYSMRLSGPIHEVRRRLAIRQRQAEPLLEQFANRLPDATRVIIERFVATRDQSFFARRFTLVGNGHTYPDVTRNLAMMLFC